MSDLTGQPAELTFRLEIKRAATGQTEVFDMVGHIAPKEQPAEPIDQQETPECQ